jgi:hypothetical protein
MKNPTPGGCIRRRFRVLDHLPRSRPVHAGPPIRAAGQPSCTRRTHVPAKLTDNDRKRFLDHALRAADWFVRTQLGQWRPFADAGDDRLVDDDHYFAAETFEGHRNKARPWTESRGIAFNTDRGRFLYYYYMPDGRHVPGLNWTMGRALFVLAEAYKITAENRYRESAEFGAKYIAALQVIDPHYEKAVGAMRELTPQGIVGGCLDGAQAASGLLMLERVTGQANYLRLGTAFCDFLVRNFSTERGLPTRVTLWPEERVGHGRNDEWGQSCIQNGVAIPLWHLFRRTGEDRYLKPVLWAADRILECQRPDGALNTCRDISKRKPPTPNHHHGIGEGDERYVLRNDDGIVVLILGAYEATGQKKYLDAAVAYARWIVSTTPGERPFCVFPVQANNVLDVGKVAGIDFSEWVLDHLQARVLDLQVSDSGDAKADGGFRGEDEQGEGGVFGGTSLDYVVTRTTCYAAGTLYRLSGKGTGAGFSVLGL